LNFVLKLFGLLIEKFYKLTDDQYIPKLLETYKNLLSLTLLIIRVELVRASFATPVHLNKGELYRESSSTFKGFE